MAAVPTENPELITEPLDGTYREQLAEAPAGALFPRHPQEPGQ
jgi:hypothetical protein